MATKPRCKKWRMKIWGIRLGFSRCRDNTLTGLSFDQWSSRTMINPTASTSSEDGRIHVKHASVGLEQMGGHPCTCSKSISAAKKEAKAIPRWCRSRLARRYRRFKILKFRAMQASHRPSQLIATGIKVLTNGHSWMSKEGSICFLLKQSCTSWSKPEFEHFISWLNNYKTLCFR